MTDLMGAAIVVTGAGNGMGATYARGAAGLGANVVVNDVNVEAAETIAGQIRAAGGNAVAEPRDIRDPAAAQSLIDRCITEFGAITGLVNNAAVQVVGLLEEATLDELRSVIDVNIVGVFNCARAAVGPMLRQRHGSIVNITSGAHTGQDRLGCYGATKGAVASFTYAWAGELRGRGVRVNAISPMASTGMSNFDPDLPAPEANVPPVMYLLSERSQHLTGQIIRIIGNRLSLMSHPANRIPVLERETWTLASVAEAFETTLAGHELPTNVANYDIVSVSPERKA